MSDSSILGNDYQKHTLICIMLFHFKDQQQFQIYVWQFICSFLFLIYLNYLCCWNCFIITRLILKLWLICLSPFETLHNEFCGDSIHVIGITSETRISLWWLHYFCAQMTKGHLFGAHFSVISLLRVKWRSGSVDCSSWQSNIVWTSAASQRFHCGEPWPRENRLGLG